MIPSSALTHPEKSSMQLWPAIDLRGGRCVRLLQGDYDRETVFSADPVDQVRRFVALRGIAWTRITYHVVLPDGRVVD